MMIKLHWGDFSLGNDILLTLIKTAFGPFLYCSRDYLKCFSIAFDYSVITVDIW